jgi:hypothetical protein
MSAAAADSEDALLLADAAAVRSHRLDDTVKLETRDISGRVVRRRIQATRLQEVCAVHSG